MANKKIQATATLFLDTKDAQDDAKKFVNDLKLKLSEVETAADKMTVFKDMVAYIAQVDRALSALRKNNKDAFNSMFDGLDINLKQQLEGLFGVNGAQLGQVDALREKLNTLTLKSSIKEIRTFAKEINTLFTSIGVSAPFDNINEQFSGRTNTGHIQALATSLANFATVWEDTAARVSGGFGIGGSSGSSSGGFSGFSKEVQEEIDRLKQKKQELYEIISAINKEPIKIQTDASNDTAELTKLIDAYKAVQKQMNSKEYMNSSFAEQNKLIAERVRLATLLKNTSDDIINNKGHSVSAFDMATSGESMRAIDNAKSYLDSFYSNSKGKADEIKNIYTTLAFDIDAEISKIQANSLNVDGTRESLSAALDTLRQFDILINNPNISNSAYDTISTSIETLTEKIRNLASTDEQLKVIDNLLDFFDFDHGKDTINSRLDELCKTLSIDVPKSAEKAKQSIDNITSGQNTSSQQNISILAKQLQTIYDESRKIGDRELGFTVDANGMAYFVESAARVVKAADEASVAVASLNKNMSFFGHTHPDGGGLFSVDDIYSAISQKRSGVNSPTMLIGKTAASILNLDGVSDAILKEIEVYLKQFERDAAVSPKMANALQGIFEKGGLFNAFQIVDTSTGMDALASAIQNIANNATEAQTPLQKLQSLIAYYSGSKLSANNISEFTKEWKAFENGAKSASEVFDSVMHKLGATDTDGNAFNTTGKQYVNLSATLNELKSSANNTGSSVDQTKTKVDNLLHSLQQLNDQASKSTNINELSDIVSKRQQIIQAAEQEGILTNEVLQTQKEITAAIEQRISAQQAGQQKFNDISAYTAGFRSQNIYAWDDATIGQSIGQIDAYQKELAELASQGIITANQLQEVTNALNEQKSALESAKHGYTDYYSGYDYTYYGEYKDAQREAELLRSELNELKVAKDKLYETPEGQLAFFEGMTTSADRAEKEVNDLGDAIKKVYALDGQMNMFDNVVSQSNAVTNAASGTRVQASTSEGVLVDSTIQSEIYQLELLRLKIEEVKEAIDVKTQAFVAEGTTAESTVRSEISSLKELLSILETIASKAGIARQNISNVNTNAQHVIKTVKPGQELNNILNQDDNINQQATIIQNYIKAKQDLDKKVQEILADSQKNGGIINQSDLDLIHAMSKEVTRLGSVIQSEYAKVSKLKGAGGLFDKLDSTTINDNLENRLNKYLNDKARLSMQSVTNIQYDSVTKTMTAGLVSLSGEISKVKLEYSELFDSVQTISLKGSHAIDGVEQKIKSLKESISDAMKGGLINDNLQEYKAFDNAIVQLNDHVNNLQSGKLAFDDASIQKWIELRQAVIDTGNALQQIGNSNLAAKNKALQDYQANASKIFKGLDFDSSLNSKTPEQQKIIDAYNGIIDKINLLKQSHSALTSQQTQELDQLTKSLNDQAVAYQQLAEFNKNKSAQVDAFDKYKKDLNGVDYGVKDLQKNLEGLYLELQKVSTPKDLDDWIAKFDELQRTVNKSKIGFVASNNTIIDNVQKELTGSFNKLPQSQKNSLIEEYAQVIALLKQQKEEVKSGHAVELSGIKNITAALQEKINLLIKENEETEKSSAAKQKNANFGMTNTINAKARFNTLTQQLASEPFLNSSTTQVAVAQYTQAFDSLINKANQLRSQDVITEQDKVDFEELAKKCNSYATALDNIIKKSFELKSKSNNGNTYLLGKDIDTSNISQMHNVMNEFAASMSNSSAKLIEFNDMQQTATYAVRDAEGHVQQLTVAYDAGTQSLVGYVSKTKMATTEWSKFGASMKQGMKNVLRYISTFGSFYRIISVIRNGINYVKEIDLAMTELRKVTDETEATYDRFLQTASKTSSVIGSTVKDLTSSAADWARLGYSMKQAGELAATTAKLLNVSEFTSVDEATSALVSSLQAFTTEGQDVGQRAEEIVDVLNHIGNRYPVATNELADGLATSSAALVAANNSIEEQVAMLAAGNATMQDISAVASGLKIVAARLRGTTSEADDDAESAVTNVSKLQEKIKALTAEANGGEGIDIINEQGEYKSTFEILSEISKIFDKMDDLSAASLLELVAGKNRSSVVAAILQNGDILKEAYADAFKADASSQKELDTYLSSIQGRIDLFNNAVQTMWMNFVDSSFVKGIVDIGTAFIEFLDSGAGKVAALSAAIAVLGKVLKINAFSSVNGELQIFGKTIDTIRNNFTKLSAESTGVFGKLKAGLVSVFTDGNKIDISKILSQDTFDNELTKAIDIFKSQGQVIDEVNWGKYVDGVSQADAAMGAALKTCEIQNGTIVAGSNAYQTYTSAATGAAVGTTAVGGAAQTTTGKLIAMKVAALAASAALTLGLSLLVSLAVQGISALANVGEAAREAAQDAANASQQLREQTDSLKDYKAEISSLRTELDSNNLSEAEAYDARERLLQIQNKLIDKYGEEAKGINLVTGELEKQKAVIDSFSQKESQQWLDTHRSEYLDAIEYFDSDNKGSFLDHWYEGFGATRISNYAVPDEIKKIVADFASTQDNMSAWTDNLGFHNVDFNGSVEEVKTQVDDFISFLNEQEERLNKEIKNAEVSGDLGLADTLRKNLKSLQDYQKDIGKEYTNWFGENSTYAANKTVMDEAKYQTAMAKYTDQYMDILDAQNKLTEAQAKGGPETIKSAIDAQQAAIEKAMKDAEAKGQSWMVDYFKSFADGLAEQEFEINVKLNEDGLQDQLNTIVQTSGLSTLDNNQILDMVDRGLNIEGTTDVSGQYTAEQISGLLALQAEANKAGISIESLIGILTNLRIVTGRATEEIVEPVEAVAQTYSAIKESVDSYNEVLSQSYEYIHDNIESTEEYYNTLKELGISEEELGECIDKNNGYLVTNADKLKKLIKEQKDEYKNNVKTAKSQAKLKYYKLAKDLIKTVKSTDNLTDAQKDHIRATLEEMDAVQDTISKYTMLESELLGVTNAYTKLAEAQEIDSTTDYGSKAEEMVNALADAFNTGELGTAAAEVAFEGLIPDWVVANAQSVDEAMESAYNYMQSGALAGLFDIKYDDDGKLESVKMTLDKVKAFTSALTEADTVFHGTWDEFTLDPAIQNLEDFANAIGVTEEVAFAYLTELERYDASNIFGDSATGLLDQLMSEDLDYAIMDKVQKIADIEKKILDGAATSEDVQIYSALSTELDRLEDKALDFADAWAKTSDQLTDAREEAESLGRELAGAKDGVNESTGRTVEEIEADIKENDQLISNLLSNLSKLKDEFGGEPTEMVVGVALDEVKEDIDDFKKDLEKKPAKLKAAITEIDSTGFENLGLTKNADGSWSGLVELDWYQKLDPASQAEVTNYLNMIESEHYLNLLMGDGVPSMEEHLQKIADTLAEISEKMDPVYTLYADTSSAINNVRNFLSWWTSSSLTDKVVTLYQRTIGSWFGGDNVNGNAQFSGAARVSGNAFAKGSIGAKKTEESLVGELGPEIIVRGNRWFTVGENGAEFTQVKKGDIIFNHNQSKQLLKNGHVTGRGKAYASGTAYAGVDTSTPYVPPIVSSGGNSDSNDDDDIADYAEEVVDFIEMKLEEIEEIITKTTGRIGNFLDDTTTIKSKDELYDELVKAEKDKSEAYLKAAQKYNVEAAAALSGVPQQYQEMARNGAIAIEDFIGEDQVEIAEKIQEYRDWAAKAAEAENGHLEAIAAISAYRVEQLEDIATDFENIINITQSRSDLLQAEMDLIEESGNRLSESHYEELKKYSQQQLNDMEKERAALQKILDDSVAAGDVIVGSDDWYSMLDTINEVDKGIIECKIDLEEFQNAINELYWDNFDKIIDKLDNVNDELSHQYDLISDAENIVDKYGNWTKDGRTSLELLTQQIETSEQKLKEYDIAINQLKKDYRDGFYSMDEYDEKLAELTDGYYDTIDAIEDTKDAIRDLYKIRFDTTKTGFENIIGISQSHADLLQSEMDLIEESGNRLSENYYEELKKYSQRQMNDMLAERAALQKILDDAIATGNVVVGSDDWHSMVQDIYDVDQSIIDCKTNLEGFQNSINELYWDNFNKLIDEIDNVDSELSNLYDLVSDADDIVDEAGNWTADGYTALGLLAQQMEAAQQKSEKYGNAISKLKKDYKDGLYSTDEYNEKLAELTDGQYDAIKSYESAKDAIISLNKTRVDAVKDGINKEIDAYSELIEKKKESLSADKDARDFERSIEDNNQSIKDVERKLASLQGNTSSSAIAERRRLESELLKLQQEREDLFYNESVENQQEALDKELENFQDAKNKEIEDLEEYLKNQEKVLQDSFAIVQENTQQIAGNLVEIAEEYGVTISDTVSTPWIKGVNAIGTYEEQLDTTVSATTKNLEILKQQLQNLQAQADKTANSVINATQSTVTNTSGSQQTGITGYAKGTTSVPKSGLYNLDELGPELVLHAGKNGKLEYLTMDSAVIPADLTQKLMQWGQLDPSQVLENNRPVIGTPGITTTNNNISIDMHIAEVVHIDHADNNSISDISKAIKTQMDNYMRDINNKLRRK